MDFDHIEERGTKLYTIGSGISSMPSMQVLLDEIEKCDIVCANCHRHRTWMRKTQPKSAEVTGFEPAEELPSPV